MIILNKMPIVLPISPKILAKAKKHNLEKKLNKQLQLLANNPNHPSLKVELLKPASLGIYSFRLGRKYRALFIFRPDKQAIEILNLTVHYH